MQKKSDESDEEFYEPADNLEDLNKLKASNPKNFTKNIFNIQNKKNEKEIKIKDEIKNESDSTFSDKEQKSLQNILDKLDETTTIVYQNPEENQTEKNKKNITDFLEGRESNKSLESPFASKDSSKSSNSNSIAISSFSTPNKIDRSSISNSSSKKKEDFKFSSESLKQHDKTNSNFNNLVCLQYISNAEITKIDNAKAKPISQPIWVAKFSPDNKFLATGGSDTVLKVFKLSLVSENEEDYEIGLQLLDSNYIALQKHTFDIIDISWYKDSTRILTSSIDQKVILWNFKLQSVLKIFDHSDIVSCISFHPLVDEFFASGCFDKIIRIWDMNESKVVDWVQSNDLITALTFSPDKQHLLVGYFKGVVKVYRADQGKLKFITDISCKNSYAWGKLNKVGKKVTSILFVEDDEFIVTTNDSRMRLIDFRTFEIKLKYKGYSSAKLHIQASYNYEKQLILSGSEDGKVYIWNKYTEFVPQINPMYTFQKKNRNNSYEYFKPFPKINTTCAIWANHEILKAYKEKIAGKYKNLYIDSLMILISFESDIKVVGNLIELE